MEPETKGAEGVEALNPDDPEVRAINQGTDAPVAPQKERQASVEEVPDESDRIQRTLAQQSILNESLHPSRSSSLPPHPPSTTGVVPNAENPTPATPSAPDLPSAPSDLKLPQTPSALPDTPQTFTDPSAAFQSFPPPAVVQMSNAPDSTLPSNIAKPVIPSATTTSPVTGLNAPAPVPAPAPAPTSSTVQTSQPSSAYHIDADDQSITQAQKHARWAVSALSFDDVNTAIKELKIALRHLGAE